MTGDVNTAAPHPNESQLRGLLQGTLPSADEAAVLALLEREPAWQEALDRLVADETTWRAAAQSLQRPPLAADPMLRSVLASAALWSARSASGDSAAATTSSGDTSAHGVSGPRTDDEGAVDLHFLWPSDDPTYLGKLGPYLIEEVLGRGGFGLVLKARDPKLARIVAIKVLAPHLAASGTACQRFEREARAAAAVAHEHVITIYSVDSDPLPHLVMQFVAGQSLQDKLDREGPLGIKEALRIGMQTAAGLAAAHKQGLVHRDIKPANILLENGIERVKLTDFGLARAADDASLTRSGTIAGTPQYMSPEQARGETVDARSDLFSLGTVLYAMLTGRSPFRADSTLAVLKRVCDDPPRPIREVNPDVPDWLAVLITRLLAKNPDDRPDSAEEIADQLGYYLSQLQQPALVGGKDVPRRPSVMRVVPALTTAPQTAPVSDSVRRRIDRMAFAHLAMIPLSALGVGIAAIVEMGGVESRYGEIELTYLVFTWIMALAFPIPLFTALLTLRRASYPVLMAGTLLTLFTSGLLNVACLPLTMSIMIWVLVQLQRDDVRAALAGGIGSRGNFRQSVQSLFRAATVAELPRQAEPAAVTKGETPPTLDLAEARRFVQPMGCALLAVAAFQLAAVPALFSWIMLMGRPPDLPQPEILVPAVILIWFMALSSIVPLVGGVLTLRLAWYRAAIGCAWISLVTALLNITSWPVVVGLGAWAVWWLSKRKARDAFAIAEPNRLTSDGRFDQRWLRLQIRPIGLAFLASAALCWIGMIGLVGFVNLTSSPRAIPRPEILYPVVGLAWFLGAFSIVPLGAGILALRRGAYHAVAGGAWLSLLPALANIPCWPVSVGIAIWLVRQLWRNEVREAFAHSPQPARHNSLATGDAPMLAKPAKYDPFADAPPTPTRSRTASALLGLALLLGGLLTLGCLGAVGSYFWHNSGNAGKLYMGRLVVKIPDRRLKATLRLEDVDNPGYSAGAAMQYINEQLPIVPGSIYKLKAGDYLLTVKSDDVTVFSDNIHINADGGMSVPQAYEVKPGGILNLEVQGSFITVEVNGHPFVEEVTQQSQRMLVVPEGPLLIKGSTFRRVFAEKWLEMRAGEEMTVRVTSQSIEVIPGAGKATPAKSSH